MKNWNKRNKNYYFFIENKERRQEFTVQYCFRHWFPHSSFIASHFLLDASGLDTIMSDSMRRFRHFAFCCVIFRHFRHYCFFYFFRLFVFSVIFRHHFFCYYSLPSAFFYITPFIIFSLRLVPSFSSIFVKFHHWIRTYSINFVVASSYGFLINRVSFSDQV